MTMVNTISQGINKRYPTRMVLGIGDISSSTWYSKSTEKKNKQKPGPKPVVSDEDLLVELKKEIAEAKFHSEGYKKIHKRVRNREIMCGANRVYRLLAEHKLLAPQRPIFNGSARDHNGTIVTELPNKMWGTDGKQFYTQAEGLCWLFSTIDHCNDEILGWHVAKVGNRFAAMEPVKQAVQREYGKVDKHICKDTGLFLRSDHGSQYDSNDFQNELKFLGLAHSPAFVRSPECNGVIERFHRTITQQIFDLHCFENLEEATEVIKVFMDDYNNNWLIHRLGLKTPIQFKRDFNNLESLKSA